MINLGRNTLKIFLDGYYENSWFHNVHLKYIYSLFPCLDTLTWNMKKDHEWM